MKSIRLYLICIGSFLFLPWQSVFANNSPIQETLYLPALDSLPESQTNFKQAYIDAEEVAAPWSDISITDGNMKPFYPAIVVGGSPFPIIPVLAGVVGAGVITYILVKPQNENDDCSFSGMAQSQASTCALANGSVTLMVSLEADYTYQWSNGSTSKNLQNIEAGNYVVTITRTGTSCTQVVSTIVENNNPPFTVTITTEEADCGISNGTASASVSPAGSYAFNWSNGATAQNLTDLSPGPYTLTVTSSGSCTEVASTTIEENLPEFSVSITSTPSSCGVNDGTVTTQVDPSGTYTFLWSNGATSQNLTELPPGSYTLTVTSSGSCTQIASTTIEENLPEFLVSLSSTPSSCGVNDGTATAQVDPPGTYTYLWSNGEMGELISAISPGTYSVTVTVPGSNCSVSGTVTVDEGSPAFEITSETFPSECGSSTGIALITVAPEGAYIYQWSNGGSSSEQNDISAGTYQVTVTIEGTSCTKEISVTVDELPPTMVLTFNSTPAGCGVSNGSATVMVDPPGAYDYVWSNGATSSSLSDVPSGQYVVTVSIFGTTCSVIGMVEVGQTGGGFTAIFNTENADCGLSNGSAIITVEPPGEYTFEWSNQQTEPDLTDVETGTYTVTVTDENECTESFSVSIGENPAEFITIISTSPANCITSGEITFSLNTPGAGPLVVVVEGPMGTTNFSLPPGLFMLSTLMNVEAGEYIITVHDETIGEQCKDDGTAIVIDNTPDLQAMDDFFMTPGGEPLLANALGNDSGLDIQMTDVSNEFGGSVTFDAFGDFIFTPDPGFSGDASFTYTITDACGNTSTAVVTVFVEMVDCEFDVDFATTPASCGLEDGSATVEVLEPGVYEYEWSNGDTGQTISDLDAGSYSVTIMDINLGCGLVFFIDIVELPADYISDIIITQPLCGGAGEIQFTAFTTSQNPLIMSVIHPNGSENIFIDPGIILLSDYIPLTPGDYIIEVTGADSGPDCFENFEVTLLASEQIEIFVEAVFPPTEPTSMDGSAIIIISVPGSPPYTVFLDGVSILTTPDDVFTIENLDVGEYVVQVVDDVGCTSNEVLIIVPFPGITFSFGTSLLYLSPDQSNEQPNHLSTDYLLRNAVMVSMHYYIGQVRQTTRLTYASSFANPYAELLFLSDISDLDLGKAKFVLQGGIGSAFGSHPVSASELAVASPLWSLRAAAGYTIKRTVKLNGSISLQGWDQIKRPIVELSAICTLKGSK